LRTARRYVPQRTRRLYHTLRVSSVRRAREVRVTISAGSSSVRYARTQEEGATIITAGRLMTVPIGVRQHPFRPRDVPDPFLLRARNGRLFIAQRVGRDGLRLLWMLTNRVRVRAPEDRSPPWPGTVGPTKRYAAEGVRVATEGLAAKLARMANPERVRRGGA
jgi:hypothetical protein